MAHYPNWTFGGALAVFLAAASGCGQRSEIERYTVAKPVPVEEPADPHAGLGIKPPAGEPTHRTLGAVVPRGDQGWFFKLTGPKDAVAGQTETFMTLLKSVRFDGDGKPEWNVPEGWQQRPGNDIRYATLVLPAAPKPLELTVTVLPKQGDDAEYVLINVNRWRNQLSLPPLAAEALAGHSTQVEVADGKATVVDLLGTSSGNTMGRPPFMSGARDGN